MLVPAADHLTLAAARDEYFAANHFGADGGYHAAWVDFKLGPLPFPIPNTAARVRAVRFHDLHHAVTGYATDTLGEFEISAWELGSGCAGFVAAWQLNLMGMAAGVLSIPRRTFRAFVHGRHTRNFYRDTYDDALLSRRVGEVRAALGLDREVPRGTIGDGLRFALYFALGLALSLVSLPLLLPLALLGNLAFALDRRRPSTPRA